MLSRQSRSSRWGHNDLVATDDGRDGVYRILPEETKVEANRDLVTRT